MYFWRTQDQQEIDYIEERDGALHAYEIKWNPKRKARLSKTFSGAYSNVSFETITPDNFNTFLSCKELPGDVDQGIKVAIEIITS